VENEIELPHEKRQQPYLFDAIIVLGAKVAKKTHNEHIAGIEPGLNYKMRLIAATEAYEQKLAPIIVLTGGNTSSNDSADFPTQARVGKEFLERKYRENDENFNKIPPEAIILEDESKDTASNLTNLLQLIKDKNWHQVAILTNDFHLKRAEEIAHNFGLEVKGLSAEDMLVARDPRFANVVNKYNDSLQMKITQTKEKALRLLMVVDRKAAIPTFLAEHMRG